MNTRTYWRLSLLLDLCESATAMSYINCVVYRDERPQICGWVAFIKMFCSMYVLLYVYGLTDKMNAKMYYTINVNIRVYFETDCSRSLHGTPGKRNGNIGAQKIKWPFDVKPGQLLLQKSSGRWQIAEHGTHWTTRPSKYSSLAHTLLCIKQTDNNCENGYHMLSITRHNLRCDTTYENLTWDHDESLTA